MKLTTQNIRVFDVLVIGPLMIWAATARRQLPDWAKFTLIASGVATIAYNGWNYTVRQEPVP